MFEELAFKALQLAATTSPIATAIVLLLGVVLTLCELFIKASPGQEDDKKWAAVKSGYLGPFIGFFISFVKSFFTKFIKK